jgi:hypothetical protein
MIRSLFYRFSVQLENNFKKDKKKFGSINNVDVYLHRNTISESSSVGRARPCQGRGREFESRFSLQSLPFWKAFFLID